MTSGIYNQAKYDLMTKATNLSSDTIKVALMTDTHSFDPTHTNWTDVSANEITGTGYTTGGATLTGKSVTKAATTFWDATDATWTSATFTAYHAIIYDTSNSNNLIASIDFSGIQSVSAGTFTIQWNALGLVSLT